MTSCDRRAEATPRRRNPSVTTTTNGGASTATATYLKGNFGAEPENAPVCAATGSIGGADVTAAAACIDPGKIRTSGKHVARLLLGRLQMHVAKPGESLSIVLGTNIDGKSLYRLSFNADRPISSVDQMRVNLVLG